MDKIVKTPYYNGSLRCNNISADCGIIPTLKAQEHGHEKAVYLTGGGEKWINYLKLQS